MTARDWLLANEYEDIVALIEEIETEWRAAGKRTRRNWWAILAGGRGGRSRTVEGRAFPVLVVAQMHEGVPITPNAIRRSATELAPKKVYLGKWSRRTKSNA